MHQTDEALLEIIGHLGAILIQASACDDQIIMGHVVDAHGLAASLRRELIAASYRADVRRDERVGV